MKDRHDNKKNTIRLQDIFLDEAFLSDEMKDLVVRGDVNNIKKMGDYMTFAPGVYDFSTYFNSLSVRKWNLYTHAYDFILELDIKGSFSIEVIGYTNSGKNSVRAKKLHTVDFVNNKRKRSVIRINEVRFDLISFILTANNELSFYDGAYTASVDEGMIKNIHLTLMTTTYKKEKYVKQNKEILENSVFKDKNISDNLNWIIVDNGKSNELLQFESPKIKVFPNKNSGGSGGAARGMMEIAAMKGETTHLLIMDDDVKFVPYSFYKLLSFLKILKREYENDFIAGAMLEMERPYFQHEDLGHVGPYAIIGPAKPPRNMGILSNIVKNEKIMKRNSLHYSAWWFCCVPVSVVRPDNLPLPLFIRSDDIEFSIRNKAGIITMNGICIWHDSFSGRFKYSTDMYQSFRNELIISALHKNIHDAGIFKKVYDIFWQEMFKFNYKGAELVADAFEDYLKGPAFLEENDGGKILNEKMQKDLERMKMPESMYGSIDRDRLYTYQDLKAWEKALYNYTCNGQKRMTFLGKGRKGMIPLGWGYYQKKMLLCDEVYAVDLYSGTYMIFRKDIKKFRDMEKRFRKIMDQYKTTGKKVRRDYIKAQSYLSSSDFWRKYLELDQ